MNGGDPENFLSTKLATVAKMARLEVAARATEIRFSHSSRSEGRGWSTAGGSLIEKQRWDIVDANDSNARSLAGAQCPSCERCGCGEKCHRGQEGSSRRLGARSGEPAD